MNTNKSRVIITVMHDQPDEDWVWIARYNPGQGEPNLQAEGQSRTKKKAFSAAFAEACRFVGETPTEEAT